MAFPQSRQPHRERHRHFILTQQNPDGGFGGRGLPVEYANAEPEGRESDLYYTAFGIRADLIAGPATDNRVGERFVASLGLPARNARADAEALGKFVLGLVEAKFAAKA